MNPAKKGKEEWWDFSWNSFVGCSNGCEWCYARRQAKRVGAIIGCEKCARFEFHQHAERFCQPMKVNRPSIIFLGSMCDLFCGAAMGYVEQNPLRHCDPLKLPDRIRSMPQHQFVVLTKSPQNIPQGWNDGVPNLWVGVSVTGGYVIGDWERDERVQLKLLGRVNVRRILCLEPCLGNVITNMFQAFNWIIVGGLTGGRRELHLDAVRRIVLIGQENSIPVFLKRNLAPEVPMEYVLAHREYPPELAGAKGAK